MKAKQTYLKGKSIFIVSLIVIIITILTVYLTRENYNRTVTSNLYLALIIIGTALFLFMTYVLYKGVGPTEDFPIHKDFKIGGWVSISGTNVDLPSVEVGDGVHYNVYFALDSNDISYFYSPRCFGSIILGFNFYYFSNAILGVLLSIETCIRKIKRNERKPKYFCNVLP